MDPITHTLTGAALAEAGLKRQTALAWPALLIGANLPDIDVLALFGGDALGLAFRRGWTHGVLAMALLPLLLTGLLLLWDMTVRRSTRGPVRPARLLLISALAAWSHPVLDWLNIYGIRLGMPFSERWFYGDALFIVDPWVWGLLVLGVWLARRRGAGPARLSLGAFALYAAAMWAGSAAVRSAVPEQSPRGRVVAAPVPLNPLERRILVETEDRYLRGQAEFGRALELEAPGGGIPKRWELAETVSEHRKARRFLSWARLPYFVPLEGHIRVGDARYEWAAVRVQTAP